MASILGSRDGVRENARQPLQQSQQLVLLTSDGHELSVDRQLFCYCSRVFEGMLTDLTEVKEPLKVDESRAVLSAAIDLMQDKPLPEVFSNQYLNGSTQYAPIIAVWDSCKAVLVVADKYDMPLVRERLEKWLLFRILRARAQSCSPEFTCVFAYEWWALCIKYDLKELGWHMAVALGRHLNGPTCAAKLLDCVRKFPDVHVSVTELVTVLESAVRNR